MFPLLENRKPLERLTLQVRGSSAPTIDLFLRVIAECPRLSTLIQSGKASLLERALQAGAWTDAALAATNLEIPAWSVRRLVSEDGEWLCSLTRQQQMPTEFDDTVDAYHECLPLAILGALIEVRRKGSGAHAGSSLGHRMPRVAASPEIAACCDNFA